MWYLSILSSLCIIVVDLAFPHPFSLIAFYTPKLAHFSQNPFVMLSMLVFSCMQFNNSAVLVILAINLKNNLKSFNNFFPFLISGKVFMHAVSYLVMYATERLKYKIMLYCVYDILRRGM